MSFSAFRVAALAVGCNCALASAAVTQGQQQSGWSVVIRPVSWHSVGCEGPALTEPVAPPVAVNQFFHGAGARICWPEPKIPTTTMTAAIRVDGGQGLLVRRDDRASLVCVLSTDASREEAEVKPWIRAIAEWSPGAAGAEGPSIQLSRP